MIKFLLGALVALAIMNPDTTKAVASKTVDTIVGVTNYVAKKVSDGE